MSSVLKEQILSIPSGWAGWAGPGWARPEPLSSLFNRFAHSAGPIRLAAADYLLCFIVCSVAHPPRRNASNLFIENKQSLNCNGDPNSDATNESISSVFEK